jgi:hypothetical protein
MAEKHPFLTFQKKTNFHGLQFVFLWLNILYFCMLQMRIRKKQKSHFEGQCNELKSALAKSH